MRQRENLSGPIVAGDRPPHPPAWLARRFSAYEASQPAPLKPIPADSHEEVDLGAVDFNGNGRLRVFVTTTPGIKFRFVIVTRKGEVYQFNATGGTLNEWWPTAHALATGRATAAVLTDMPLEDLR